LFNLLSNAFKFTPRGGTVIVTLRPAGDDAVEVSVSDTGIGIAAEDIPRLMQPFVQVDDVYKRRTQGSGLGLAIVRSLVERHGGSVRIESKEGAGTRITLRLPVGGPGGA
jgi:signal transduction histidine kinase